MIENFLSGINCIIDNKIIKPNVIPPISPYIIFADPVVKQICVENWGSDGEITYEQAAAVTDLETAFGGNTEITSFNELRYFIGLTQIEEYAFQNCIGLTSMEIPDFITSIGESAFDGCTGLISITIPNSVTSIGVQVFASCTGLISITSENINPPILGASAFSGTPLENIYVPSESVDTYKTAGLEYIRK